MLSSLSLQIACSNLRISDPNYEINEFKIKNKFNNQYEFIKICQCILNINDKFEMYRYIVQNNNIGEAISNVSKIALNAIKNKFYNLDSNINCINKINTIEEISLDLPNYIESQSIFPDDNFYNLDNFSFSTELSNSFESSDFNELSNSFESSDFNELSNSFESSDFNEL